MINIFDLSKVNAPYMAELSAAVGRVVNSGWYIRGAETSRFEEEYARRHAALWPELRKQLADAGVRNYSIYWDKDTNILFGYQEIEGETSSQDMGADEVTRKWWDYMADLMEVNPDNSPVTVSLREVFHLD